MGDFQTSDMVTARKDYPCEECEKGIKRGQKYARIFSVCDGHACTVRLCWRCQRSWHRFQARWGHSYDWEVGGPGFGQLLNCLRMEHRPSDSRDVADRRKRLGKTSEWMENARG